MRWRLPDANSWSEAAEKEYKHAADLDSRYEWPLINLGILTLRRTDHPGIQEYENARSYFEKALRIAPNNPNAVMNSAAVAMQLGILFEQEHDNMRALQYFGEASKGFTMA